MVMRHVWIAVGVLLSGSVRDRLRRLAAVERPGVRRVGWRLNSDEAWLLGVFVVLLLYTAPMLVTLIWNRDAGFGW